MAHTRCRANMARIRQSGPDFCLGLQAQVLKTSQVGPSSQAERRIQEYLDHKKQRPPRTLQCDYAWGPMVALGGGGVAYG
jgi:hypothetical protein